ncbi:hypothetical protein AK830_g963 [Neonectria ditissima]|uniref:Uncharacterized protein n=1 Tax=Neonectria ditissima TaxID=78410 RepID=A0A0P7BXL3_9HYPO|nr:hypothetical protein AK830_g963 [Neonectria ditissima]
MAPAEVWRSLDPSTDPSPSVYYAPAPGARRRPLAVGAPATHQRRHRTTPRAIGQTIGWAISALGTCPSQGTHRNGFGTAGWDVPCNLISEYGTACLAAPSRRTEVSGAQAPFAWVPRGYWIFVDISGPG